MNMALSTSLHLRSVLQYIPYASHHDLIAAIKWLIYDITGGAKRKYVQRTSESCLRFTTSVVQVHNWLQVECCSF